MSLLRDPDVAARVDRLELPFGRDGIDPYGIAKKDLVWFFSLLGLLYKKWFRVTVHGLEHVPPRGRGMLIGNHSGGVAIDGGMVLAAMILEMEPPRLAQGMAEKFINKMPFGSMWSSRLGQLTGLPEHAERLLNDERLLMVFPEGARGTAKLYWQRNSLVDFGTGFMRLALATQTPILPFAFAGGGDAYPTIANLYRLGRLVGAPYLPVTAYLAPIPRRVRLAIQFGEPMRFTGTGREDDEVIADYVQQVKDRVADLLRQAEEHRRQR